MLSEALSASTRRALWGVSNFRAKSLQGAGPPTVDGPFAALRSSGKSSSARIAGCGIGDCQRTNQRFSLISFPGGPVYINSVGRYPSSGIHVCR